MRNDPFFKSVQKDLTSMFKVSQKEESSVTKTNSQRKEIKEVVQPSTEVKKKILELQSIDQDKCVQLVDLY